MKSVIVISLLLCATSGVFAANDSVFVKMQGDTVQIWNTDAVFNCCSRYIFYVSVTDFHTIMCIEWDTSSGLCRCNCKFDLYTSLTGLDQGSYLVKIYRMMPEADTIVYVGAASFEIGSPGTGFKIAHQYQSLCKGSTDIPNTQNFTPMAFELLQNYPNPFNPATIISYTVPQSSLVSLKVYDLMGREVTSLVDEQKPAGTYSVKVDGSKWASGVYFYRIMAGKYQETKKLILMK
jgi:hypothetical protein